MKRSLRPVALVVCLLSVPSLFAQATRTWVSGVGDDANPCSRTAPCKTFAGAISRTAAGGEISVLDPGGFGAVTVTKSIVIDGAGTLASILFAGTSGVIINASGISVTLRNLTLNGAGTGLTGVRILSAARVLIDSCRIASFTTTGISDERTTAGNLTVLNTVIHDGSGTAYGILLYHSPTTARIDHVSVSNVALSGLVANQGPKMTVTNSTFHFNGTGATVFSGTGAATAFFDGCQFSNNSGGGLEVNGGAAHAYLANCSITGNLSNGINFAGGVVTSFGNNRIQDNIGNNGAGVANIGQQ